MVMKRRENMTVASRPIDSITIEQKKVSNIELFSKVSFPSLCFDVTSVSTIHKGDIRYTSNIDMHLAIYFRWSKFKHQTEAFKTRYRDFK